MPETDSAQQQQQSQQPAIGDFGSGRYSVLGQSSFKRAQDVFKLEPAKADKLARQIMSDFGGHMRNAPVTTKIGKLNSDNKVTLSEAAKVKFVSLTNALLALRALDWCAEAGRNGFSYVFTNWSACKELKEYFEKL